MQLVAQGIDTLFMKGRDAVAGIADGGVEGDEALQVVLLVGIVAVGLVEDEQGRHTIGFGRSQKAVDEGGGGLGVVHGDEQQALVQVRGQDMALLGEVGGTADDVILALFDFVDEGCALRIADDLYAVAHGYGVGTADAFQPEVTLHFALHAAPVVGLDQVPAAGILDD